MHKESSRQRRRHRRLLPLGLNWAILVSTVILIGCQDISHKTTKQLIREFINEGGKIHYGVTGEIQGVELTDKSITTGLQLLTKDTSSVKFVVLSDATLTSEIPNLLAQQSHLEMLEMRNVRVDATVQLSLKQLRVPRITLKGMYIDDELIDTVIHDGLNSLHVSNSDVTDGVFGAICEAKSLRRLTFFKCSDMQGLGLDKLKHLELEFLNFYGTSIQPYHLDILPEFKNLRTLDLYGRQIGDSDIAFLAKCRAIENLSLHDTRVTRIPQELIVDMPLRKLVLFGSPITDEGVEQLEVCGKLQELSLDGATVSYDGLLKLKKVQSLRRLVINVSLPSQAAKLQNLENELYNCEVLILND